MSKITAIRNWENDSRATAYNQAHEASVTASKRALEAKRECLKEFGYRTIPSDVKTLARELAEKKGISSKMALQELLDKHGDINSIIKKKTKRKKKRGNKAPGLIQDPKSPYGQVGKNKKITVVQGGSPGLKR